VDVLDRALSLLSLVPPDYAREVLRVAADAASRASSPADAYAIAYMEAGSDVEIRQLRSVAARLAQMLAANPGLAGELEGKLESGSAVPAEGLPWPGVFRDGDYSWIADVRIKKISYWLPYYPGEKYKTLLIDVFHAFYLLKGELREEIPPRLRFVARLASEILAARPSEAVLDEDLSVALAAKVLSRLLARLPMEKLERAVSALAGEDGEGCDEEEEGDGGGGGEEGDREDVERAIVEAVKEAVEEADELREAMIIAGRMAGKYRGRLDFTDRLSIANILSKHKLLVRFILEAIKSYDESPARTGGTLEFHGYKSMEDLSELPRVHLLEFAYPELLLLKRLATRELRVRRYEHGSRSQGRKKKYVIAIDRSGSMEGDRLEKAKALALSLLLRQDVDNVTLIFFDAAPYEPIHVNADNIVSALWKIARVSAGWGTSIDNALRKADEVSGGSADILLITDGEDNVTYKPRSRLIVVDVGFRENKSLMKVADTYIHVDDITPSIAARV